jgi:hypothetical protein
MPAKQILTAASTLVDWMASLPSHVPTMLTVLSTLAILVMTVLRSFALENSRLSSGGGREEGVK